MRCGWIVFLRRAEEVEKEDVDCWKRVDDVDEAEAASGRRGVKDAMMADIYDRVSLSINSSFRKCVCGVELGGGFTGANLVVARM